MTSDFIIPGRSSVGSFDGIADVLAIALSNVCDNFAIVVSDWSRVWSIGSLLGTTVVHFVCTINADKHTDIRHVSKSYPLSNFQCLLAL